MPLQYLSHVLVIVRLERTNTATFYYIFKETIPKIYNPAIEIVLVSPCYVPDFDLLVIFAHSPCFHIHSIQSLLHPSTYQQSCLFQVARLQQCLRRTTVTLAEEGAQRVMADELPEAGRKWVSRWLFGCSGMVFGAVVIGEGLGINME